MKKRLIIFGSIYFALDLASILVVFAWKSFGGTGSMNFLQEAITFFFTFPSDLLLSRESNLLLFLLLNTVCWTLIFGLLLFGYKKIRGLRQY